jgi:hypothetical protein
MLAWYSLEAEETEGGPQFSIRLVLPLHRLLALLEGVLPSLKELT